LIRKCGTVCSLNPLKISLSKISLVLSDTSPRPPKNKKNKKLLLLKINLSQNPLFPQIIPPPTKKKPVPSDLPPKYPFFLRLTPRIFFSLNSLEAFTVG